MKDKLFWKKPKIKTLGSAQDLIGELGSGKEPGPSDNQLVGVNIMFSWVKSSSARFDIFFSF